VILSLTIVATWHITLIVTLTIPMVLMYDYYKSPTLIAASDRLLEFNLKIMTQIEEVNCGLQTLNPKGKERKGPKPNPKSCKLNPKP